MVTDWLGVFWMLVFGLIGLWLGIAVILATGATISEFIHPRFVEHIRRCVLEKKCAGTDSRLHVFREQGAWFLMAHFGKVGALVGWWVSVFILTIVFPLGMSKRI